MSNMGPSMKKVVSFLEGKGFYIVLGLCVMAIAVSGIMMSNDRAAEEERLRLEQEEIERLLNPPETQVGSGVEITIPESIGESIINFKPGDSSHKLFQFFQYYFTTYPFIVQHLISNSCQFSNFR